MTIQRAMEILGEISTALDSAHRFGETSTRDNPEGVRWIQLSHSLADQWARELGRIKITLRAIEKELREALQC